jgi:WD40 repeat protein
MSGIFAIGTYARNIGPACCSKSHLKGLYDERDRALLLSLSGQHGGVTQLKWAPHGRLLFSGGRKDDEIICWDVRATAAPLYRARRTRF